MQRITIGLGALLIATTAATAPQGFDEWRKQQMQSFADYQSEQDKAFAGFLKQQWEEFNVMRGLVRDKTPKPKLIPPAPPKPLPPPEPVKEPSKPEPVVRVPEPAPQPLPVVPPPPVMPTPTPEPVVRRPPPPPPPAPGVRSVSFYGVPFGLERLPTMSGIGVAPPFNENKVAGFWDAISRTDHMGLVESVNKQAERRGLNDWGRVRLWQSIAEDLFPGRQSDQVLATWFFLTKSGYRARIGYGTRDVYLLVAADQTLYGAPYFTYDGVKYFYARFPGQADIERNLYSYKGSHPDANRRPSLAMERFPDLGERADVRKVRFELGGKPVDVEYRVNVPAVDFLRDYPQTEIPLYLASDLDPLARDSLVPALRPLVQGKGQKEQVDIILRFVQNAFEYQTDQDQFGKEKYMFPSETAFYRKSDCEDRSALFAYLVRELTGLQVVGLLFPGHVATAVRFTERVDGTAYSFRGDRYVVADPTYINATAGMVMPQYKDTAPQILALR